MRIILMLLCLAFFSCAGNNKVSYIAKKIEGSPSMKKVNSDFQIIDVDCAIKIDIDSIISKLVLISYVPLESTELIGAMDKVLVYDKYIYILDAYITERLFIFDRQGKLLKVIADKGEGPDEYAGLSGMSIDPDRKEICLNDRLSIGQLYYDLTGNFLRKEKGVPCSYVNILDSSIISQLAKGQSFSSNINYHIVCAVQDSVLSKGFPYEPIQEEYTVSKNALFNSLGNLLFTPTLSDTVYSIKSVEEYSVEYVIKHRHSIWVKHKEKLTNKEISDLIKNNGYTTFGGLFYETSQYIFFSMGGSLNGLIVNNYFLFDKMKRQVYELDGSNMKIVKEIVPPNLIALDGETCVASFDAYRLKELLVKNDKGYVLRNNILKSIIENSDENSNPVLVMYQLK